MRVRSSMPHRRTGAKEKAQQGRNLRSFDFNQQAKPPQRRLFIAPAPVQLCAFLRIAPQTQAGYVHIIFPKPIGKMWTLGAGRRLERQGCGEAFTQEPPPHGVRRLGLAHSSSALVRKYVTCVTGVETRTGRRCGAVKRTKKVSPH